MTKDGTVDFRKLAQEAAAEVYSPRAGRCWPWNHQWSMWEIGPRPGFLFLQCESRRCLRCGKRRVKNLY